MDNNIIAGIGRRVAGLCLLPILAMAAVVVLAQQELAGRPEQATFVLVAVIGALITALAALLTFRSLKLLVTDAWQRSEILTRRELAPTRWQSPSDEQVVGHDTTTALARMDPFAPNQLDTVPNLNADGRMAPVGPDAAYPERSQFDAPANAYPEVLSESPDLKQDVVVVDSSPSAVGYDAPDGGRASAESPASGPAGPVVRNLVKRIQAMLDRQIDLVDELELKEEDPLYLEKLFKIDHLANRMRRTADGLLVLAGADLDRRLGGPVPVLDVLRVSIGEVEDHRRVASARAESASVSAASALPLAHMAAELIENAIEFSPPTAPVEVIGRRTPDDGPIAYEIEIVDQGIGMSDAQLSEMNRLLAAPQDLTTLSGHAMGLSVVGHLARRLGARVAVAGNEAGGVTAIIQVPLAVLDGDGVTTTDEGGALGELPGSTSGEQPMPEIPSPPQVPDTRSRLPGRDRGAGQSNALPELAPVGSETAGGLETDSPASQVGGFAQRLDSGLPVLNRNVSADSVNGERYDSPSLPSHRDPDEIEEMLRRYRQGQTGIDPTASHPDGGEYE